MGVKALALGVLAVCGTAFGDVKETPETDVVIDWTRGLLIASATRIADLSAPNPTIARIRAERVASEAARDKLQAAVQKLKLATGKTVGTLASKEQRERLLKLIANPIVVNTEYGSDGTTALSVALPLESVRVVLFGAGEPPATSETSPTALVVDARGLLKNPVLALGVSSGANKYYGPALFAEDKDMAALSLGAHAVKVKGKKVEHDTIAIAEAAELDAAAKAGVLLVFVVGTP